MVQRWPVYMPSNLSYRFFGDSRGSAENNRFMINKITALDKGTSVSCQATDDREKLSNMSKTVTLDPYYSPKITTFWIDRRVNPSTHSFNENVRPQIKLRIESNPDPRLELTSTFLKVLLLNYTKDSRGYLATQLPSLKCEESGMFTIQARNG
ncbi:unnamed protein product [Mytilus edulis]|uniref:Ig-like domain-containing protein n=1 Tax=Mytilus edulis TaxID=6550 RepID=A0A8S3T2C3_MYTED|nr:unnamed protein product [Mytilus edulis]